MNFEPVEEPYGGGVQRTTSVVASGQTIMQGMNYVEKYGNVVHVYLRPVRVAQSSAWQTVTCATIPDGFRPKNNMAFNITSTFGKKALGGVSTSGTISVTSIDTYNADSTDSFTIDVTYIID